MTKPLAYDLGHNIYLIDSHFMGVTQLAGSYVINDKQLTLIETGPSPSVPYILEGLDALNLKPESIEYIIVTHIHLDHSGGAGVLLEHCPKARVVVHPRGARHLADPSRLIESAKMVYKDDFTRLFHPIKHVPEERLIIKQDGETLSIGPDRTLQFIDTPGHARHHFSIYDAKSKGIFSGDSFGIRYPRLEAMGGELYLPVTTPNQFDPDAMKDSIERMMALGIERIYLGHFGMVEKVGEVRRQVLSWLDLYVSEGERAYAQNLPVEHLADRLLERTMADQKDIDIKSNKELYTNMKGDALLSAMGIYDYLSKR